MLKLGEKGAIIQRRTGEEELGSDHGERMIIKDLC